MGPVRNSRWKKAVASWCLVCLMVPLAWAEPLSTVPDPYQEALRLSDQGDRAGAIERYNRLLEDIPNHAGAWLDLALLYCEQGDAAKAHQIFGHVEREFQTPPAIRELMAHYRQQGCVPAADPVGRLTFTVTGGRTDNANRGLDRAVIDLTLPFGVTPVRLGEAFHPRASALAAVGVSYVRDIRSLPDVSWFGAVTEKIYPSVRDLNQRSVMTGLSQQRMINGWQQEAELVVTYLSLGKRSHQTGVLGQLGVWMPATDRRAPRFGADVSASRWRYPHDSLYDNTIVEARVNMRWAPTDRLVLRSAIGRINDQADNARPGLDRRGYYFSVGGQWLMSDRVRLDLGFRQRRLLDEAAYSPLFGDRKHRSRQRQILLGLQTERRAGADGVWRLEWESARSDDNIPLFPYSSQTFTLSWQFQTDVF